MAEDRRQFWLGASEWTRAVVVYCKEPGCRANTRHGKDFCSVHILRMPYAALVCAQETAWRTADENPREPIPEVMLDEAIRLLPGTARKVARHLIIRWDTAERVLKTLAKLGLVKTFTTKRGYLAARRLDK